MSAETKPRWRIVVLQGPNLNYLGKREPEKYGRTTAAELDSLMRAHAAAKGYDLDIFYTNSEGAALDYLYAAVEKGVDGIVMNPGAWSHAGHSMRYCLQGIAVPFVEVHIRNQYTMKVVSTLADIASGVVQGFGIDSYILGLDGILSVLNNRTGDSGSRITP